MAKISSQQVFELLLQAEQRLEGNPTTTTPTDTALDRTVAIAPVAAAVPKEAEASVRVANSKKTGQAKSKVRCLITTAVVLQLASPFDGDEKEPLTVP